MDKENAGQNATVRLVGGPECWAGLAIEGVYDHSEIYEVPVDELGAYLTVPVADQLPYRPAGKVTPRAVYEPRPGEDPAVWHFRGWEPHHEEDPPPNDHR